MDEKLTTEQKRNITDEAVDMAGSALIDAMKQCGTDKIQCVVTDQDGSKYSLKIEKVDPLV